MFGLGGRKLRIEGALREAVRANVWQLRAMPGAEADAVLAAAERLLGGIEFEACGGLTLDDEMRATIAAQVALLCHRLPEATRPGKLRILLYPDIFFEPHGEQWSIRIGEVGAFGTVMLSWRYVLLAGLSPERINLVAHELAHVLDGVSGDIDGVPSLPDAAERRAWTRMVEDELDEHRLAIAREREVLISAYAASDESEFFAEATTYFLQQGAELKRERPRLYEHMARFYALDPAAWTFPDDEAADPRLEALERDRRRFLIDEYEHSVAEHPDFGGGHLELARLLAEDGRVEDALRHLDRAIALLPGDAELHRERGTLREEAGDLAGAVSDFTHALALAPGWVEVLCDRARARRLMGARDSALDDVARALAEDPESDRAYGERGAVLLERGAWLAARRAYDAALALFPDAADHLYGRATASHELGDHASALADVECAIELGADWPELGELRDDVRAAMVIAAKRPERLP